MANAVIEYGKNNTTTINKGETTNITFSAGGSYLLSKQGSSVFINAMTLPLDYSYNKIILTVTEQKDKFTITQRIYRLGFNNNSDQMSETLVPTDEPVVYKNLTQKQLDKLNEDLGLSLGLGENIVFNRTPLTGDMTASKYVSDLSDFAVDNMKGTLRVSNYFSVAEDKTNLNGESIKPQLEQTNGVGQLGDPNAPNSMTINYGTFLNETITGGKSGDNLYSTDGTDIFQIIIGSAVKGDTVYDTKSTDNIVFGTLDTDGNFIPETGLEKITFSKSGDDLVLTRPVDTKKTDKVTISNYFEPKEPSVKVNGETIDSASLILTYNGKMNKPNTIIGTDFSDKITGGKKSDTISTGKGNDIITAGKGKDTVTIDNEGIKTLNYNKGDGNDVLVVSNAKAKVNVEYNIEGVDTDILFSKSGKDLVLTRQYSQNNRTKSDGVVNIQNYFNEEGGVNIENEIKYKNTAISDIINTNGLIISGNKSKKNTLSGSVYKDIITGGKKADTISTGKGNDIITAGKGNDTVTIDGTGSKTVNFAKGDGNDTIIFSDEAASVDLVYTSGDVIRNEYSYSKTENDLVITRGYVTKNKKGVEVTKQDGTTTIKDYFKSDGTVKLANKINIDGNKLKISDKEITVTGGVYDSDIKTTVYNGTSTKDIFNYNGKNSVAFEDTNVTDDTYNVTITKGKSDLSVNDAGGNDVMNISDKSSDLRLIFNVDKNGNVVKYTDEDKNTYYSLLVFHKNSVNYKDFKNASGMVEILDYFKDLPESSTEHFAKGSGLIETINTSDVSGLDMDSWINSVAGEVASWLNTVNSNMTAMEILNSDDTDAIKSLLQVYSGIKG